MKVRINRRFYGIAEGTDFEEGQIATFTKKRLAEIEEALPGYTEPVAEAAADAAEDAGAEVG